MKIEIRPTDKLVDLGGGPLRAWRGITDSGIACIVFLHALMVADEEHSAHFDRQIIQELPAAAKVPLRTILP